MHLKTAAAILLAVNLLWAAAFLGYVRRSPPPPRFSGEPLPSSVVTGKVVFVTNSAPPPVLITNERVVFVTNSFPLAARSLASAGKKFGWADVTNETYVDYVARLRAAGVPDKLVRHIVVTDLHELFDQRRLADAIQNDPKWWKAETYMGVLPMQGSSAVNYDGPRRELLARILGEDEADAVKLPSLNSAAVQLTGPVLGALPLETWNAVQEICARSTERYQAFNLARINEGGAVNQVEFAKLRAQTREELARVLTPAQLEEFLLRYSQNSSALRTDLRGVDLSPEEFRKLFRAIDPLEHRVQVDYGGPEALSPKQRADLEAQRDRAAREALTPEHFAQYLGTKDPLFKEAQLMAMQYNLNDRAVQPLLEMQKSLAARRDQISADKSLTDQQKTNALQSVGLEHQQSLQRILADKTYRQ